MAAEHNPTIELPTLRELAPGHHAECLFRHVHEDIEKGAPRAALVAVAVAPDALAPLCAGHFPGQPLVPGATLLALMVDVARLVAPALARVEQATFRTPVPPTQTITIRVRRGGGARLIAEVLTDGATPAAAATLEAG